MQGIQGLMFVVNSSDKERIDSVKSELMMILKIEVLKEAITLKFANKQDIGVMIIAELTEILNLKH